MKPTRHLIPILLLPIALHAEVPLRWTVETSRVQPVVFDAVRGETLALEAAFKSYGTDLSTSNLTASLYWQTNGMDSAWWVTNAVTSGSSASVLFTPSMDPGASAVHAFLALATTNQLPTTSYRAAFTLRFRHGPGASPNALAAPVPILDLANTTVINVPWPTTNDFQTATTNLEATLKSYVDAEIEGAGVITPQTVTNIVDAKIASIPKEGVSTNAVSGIITNHVTSGYLATAASLSSLSAITSDVSRLTSSKRDLTNNVCAADSFTEWSLDRGTQTQYGTLSVNVYYEYAPAHSGNDYNYELRLNGVNIGNDWKDNPYEQEASWSSPTPLQGVFTATRSRIAYSNDTFTTYTFVTNAIDASVSPISSDVSSNSTAIAQVAQQAATIGAHLNAEDAKCVVTNYDSAANLPEMELTIKLTENGTSTWRSIWKEMTRWNAFTGTNFTWSAWDGFYAWSTNIEEEIDAKSPREYAFYDGVTGDVAPDGIFWISQPRIAVCAGAAYQRYVDSGSAVWLLESNGLVANINGTTNGYFRISDEEGNSQFEIIKGDKQTVFATCNSMTQTDVSGVTHWSCRYAVNNAVEAPVAYFTRSLTNINWIADTDASCPCNVSWTLGTGNTYTLEFWAKSTEPSMFVKAQYDRGGETRIKQSVPCEMTYVIINGTKYGLTPKTVNGELVMGLTTGN